MIISVESKNEVDILIVFEIEEDLIIKMLYRVNLSNYDEGLYYIRKFTDFHGSSFLWPNNEKG